jgi:hypothetical protein
MHYTAPSSVHHSLHIAFVPMKALPAELWSDIIHHVVVQQLGHPQWRCYNILAILRCRLVCRTSTPYSSMSHRINMHRYLRRRVPTLTAPTHHTSPAIPSSFYGLNIPAISQHTARSHLLHFTPSVCALQPLVRGTQQTHRHFSKPPDASHRASHSKLRHHRQPYLPEDRKQLRGPPEPLLCRSVDIKILSEVHVCVQAIAPRTFLDVY